jgi:hypothetical protein
VGFSASRPRSGARDIPKFAEKFRDEESRVCANLTGKWPNGDRKYTSKERKKFIKKFLFIWSRPGRAIIVWHGTVYRW